MSDRKREPEDSPPSDDLVDEEDFDNLLKEMQETIGLDDLTDDDEDTEDLEETGEIDPLEAGDSGDDGQPEEPTPDEPERSRSIGFHVERGMVERFDDVILDFARQTLDPDAPAEAPEPPAPPPRPPPPPPPPPPPAPETPEPVPPPEPPPPTYVDPDVTLSVRFSVHAATGGGQFRDTESRGLLVGQRSYPFVLLDDFSFGFDDKRNEYEIILDPTSASGALKDLKPNGDFSVMCDEYGEMWVLKPAGVRVDLYRIARDEAGGRRMEQVKSSESETMEPIWLPTDAVQRFDQYTEFMFGVGLTEEESLCYAFSVYVAVGLSRPKS